MGALPAVAFVRSIVLLGLAPLAQVHRWTGTWENELFGWSVDGLGDVDGDGHDDVVVGQRYGVVFGCGFEDSSVRVFSGATGAELFRLTADECDHFGHLVRGIGDWNADGAPDFLAVNAPDVIDSIAPAEVTVHSGSDGATLASYVSPWNWYDLSPKDAGAAGDVDADGFADLVFGVPTTGPAGSGPAPGWAYVHSGRTGALVRRFEGLFDGEGFGR